jgi:hypothetical protein
MAASVEHEFEDGYVLGEEQIRRLHAKILERKNTINDSFDLSVKVNLEDGLTYETQDIERLLNEENTRPSSINRVEFFSSGESRNKFNLVFSPEGSRLSVTGEERDETYLLFSDIKEYVSLNICIARNYFRAKLFQLLPLLLACAGMLYFTFSSEETRVSMNAGDVALLPNDLASLTIAQKIDIIIEYEKSRAANIEAATTKTRKNLPFLLGFAILAMVITIFGQAVWKGLLNFVNPTNVFVIGQNGAKYTGQAQIRRNVIWVVVVGFLVSFGAGFAVSNFDVGLPLNR